LDSVAVSHITASPHKASVPWICSAIMHWNNVKKGIVGKKIYI